MPSIKEPRTLYEKIFDNHIAAERDDGTVLMYVGEQQLIAIAFQAQ